MLLGMYVHAQHSPYIYGAITRSGTAFQRTSTSTSTDATSRQTSPTHSHNPTNATPAGYHTPTVWPHPISLATTLGITIVFSSCGY